MKPNQNFTKNIHPMKRLELTPTRDRPKVILDKAQGIFYFEGRSMPENVVKFYEPILEWLREYVANPNPVTVMEFKMIYFNTASAKIIMNIMEMLSDLHLAGHPVKIVWKYQDVDEDMELAGEGYAEIIDVPIEIVGYAA